MLPRSDPSTVLNAPRHELSFEESNALKEALTNLSSAAFCNREYDYQEHLAKAHSCLGTAIKCGYKAEKFTEDEADLSCFLHTFMRKYMDNAISVLLWHQLQTQTGSKVWHMFIKRLGTYELASPTKRKKFLACFAKETTLEHFIQRNINIDHETKEDMMLKYSLMLWDVESFIGAVEMYYESQK
jgi:hypothetical protein